MSTADPFPGEPTGLPPQQGNLGERDMRQILRRHLLHTREVPNGMDFLFSGPPDTLHDALRAVVVAEHARNKGLQLDFAKIGAFYLLRVLGGPERREEIVAFLEGP